MDIREVASTAYAVDGRPVPTDVHPDDEQYAYIRDLLDGDETATLLQYLGTGRYGFSVLDRILRWTGRSWQDLDSMLDFASGYGRMTRFLCRALPPERIWVSEILPAAVPFQAETFGVHGVPSFSDPGQVVFPRRYDLISVISLFTHLPQSTFGLWLEKLAAALGPGGVLMFTTHGPELFEESFGRELEQPFSFDALSEVPSLDPEMYGRTYCHPAYVEDVVRSIPGVEILAHVPRGLNRQQDVFVVGRGCPRPAAELTLPDSPVGSVDRIARLPGDGGAILSGWALDGSSFAPVKRVTVLADDCILGDAVRQLQRLDLPDVFGTESSRRGGWGLVVRPWEALPDWLVVLMEDHHGVTGIHARSLTHIVGGPVS